jgi:hypothetical protein
MVAALQGLSLSANVMSRMEAHLTPKAVFFIMMQVDLTARRQDGLSYSQASP